MDDQVQAGSSAAEGSVEPVESTTETGSAPVEQTTTGTAEKPEITQKDVQGEGDEHAEKGGEYIPKARFDEVYARMKEAEQARQLLEKLQQDPDLASEFLRRTTGKELPQVDPQMEQADKALRELGYVKSSDAANMVQNAVALELAKRDFVSKMQSLSDKYNGADGGPKFVPEEIAAYMDQTGITDPEKAYREKHLEELVDKTVKERKRGVYAEKGGQPRTTAGEDENALIREAQKSGDWTRIILNRLGK